MAVLIGVFNIYLAFRFIAKFRSWRYIFNQIDFVLMSLIFLVLSRAYTFRLNEKKKKANFPIHTSEDTVLLYSDGRTPLLLEYCTLITTAANCLQQLVK